MVKKKILIVDNEESITDMMRIYLESLGYSTVACYGGKEAMEILSMQKKFDLLLLDIMMPHVSGWDVLDFMKEDHQLQKIPVIIITAKINDNYQVRKLAEQKNIKGFIMKPFEMDQLEKKINTLEL